MGLTALRAFSLVLKLDFQEKCLLRLFWFKESWECSDLKFWERYKEGDQPSEKIADPTMVSKGLRHILKSCQWDGSLLLPGEGLGKASERVSIVASLLVFLRKHRSSETSLLGTGGGILMLNHNDIVDILRADPVFFLVGATMNV